MLPVQPHKQYVSRVDLLAKGLMEVLLESQMIGEKRIRAQM